MSVFRIYVEKKPQFAVEAKAVCADVKSALQLEGLKSIRLLNRYDVDKISKENFERAVNNVFSEPMVDYVYHKLPMMFENGRIFAIEYLPGQFDQRADSCEQCISLLTQAERCRVRNARVYIIEGDLTDDEFARLKSYLINPVESREACLEELESLEVEYEIPTTVETLDGFISLTEGELEDFIRHYGLAMDLDDIKFCSKYFKNVEQRDPTITEIRMIDTYWSDHCRHTTFLTNINEVNISAPYIQDTYNEYLDVREALGRENKPMTLMDLATIAAKKLKADGLLPELDESEEINACSIKIKANIDGELCDWILMFKNETHNHPTEIEPFGGAATCLGGAIRDPLSGRSYVYQAMRVTGAANPLVPVGDTIKGKLAQRKITVGAANGYSSYGNQIGLATGHVSEIYHPGYVAKRMEIGAVLGAAPAENIRREVPAAGDVVILLGGKTGRDGCGGATGSSKSHTLESLESCGAEVQKGNPPEERKLQRLFRNPAVTALIKRCNDFGAGGVSVAIGELADGLVIDLDSVTKKYDGLDGTELAISESQERMAVVVAADDVIKFIEYADEENLEATPVAIVTKEPRLKMKWNGNTIVNLSREFLNSNGAPKFTDISVSEPALYVNGSYADNEEGWTAMLSSLNVCSQKGLVERFDSTIGASTVLMPYGGIYQLTPNQAMACKIPVLSGETTTCSLMGWGFNPYVSDKSPYHGAMTAVIESIAKVVAAGGRYEDCYLTFQEYFERTQNNPSRWGKPFAALLGAFKAQLELKCASIGGKDSMSGTFESIDVPPTLVSFAVATTDASKVVSPEFKREGSIVILMLPTYDENGLPNFESVRKNFEKLEKMIDDGRVRAAWSIAAGGVAEGIAKMSFGNHIGFRFTKKVSARTLFNPCYGGFIVELDDMAKPGEDVIGETTFEYEIKGLDYKFSLEKLQKAWEDKLEPVFPCNIETENTEVITYNYVNKQRIAPKIKVAKPKVLIPVFPGTNCEYDTQRAFERAGAETEVFVIRNLSASAIEESIQAMEKSIRSSQIIMLPGGFSGGDEPDGSGKFITAFFRNAAIKDAVTDLLNNRDGLMLGICNGFQALIKLGLVPFGEIRDMEDSAPTLTFNSIGRHQSKMVSTRISSNKSPWLYGCQQGDIHSIAISHGEGRFVASDDLLEKMAANGQIATQYIDIAENPTMDIRFNPNASIDAIEGITSPDGRVFGKMGHSERIGSYVAKNIGGRKNQFIFENGVKYFSL